MANRLKASARLQSDETGLRAGQEERVARRWVFHHDDSAFFVAAPSRAKKVVEDWDQTAAHDQENAATLFHA